MNKLKIKKNLSLGLSFLLLPLGLLSNIPLVPFYDLFLLIILFIPIFSFVASATIYKFRSGESKLKTKFYHTPTSSRDAEHIPVYWIRKLTFWHRNFTFKF
jgi:hypothetical protein